MSEMRKGGQQLTFVGAETKTISMAANEHVAIFQVDVSIEEDTTIELRIGSTVVFAGSLVANATPIQLFFYDFGKGRGTGNLGDDLFVTLGAAGQVFITYVIFS